jgi:hypothetical protein
MRSAIQELELEAVSKNREVSGPGQDSALARKQLQGMQDIDLFRKS